MPLKKRSIFNKILVFVVFLCLLTAGFISLASIQYQSRTIERSLMEEQKVLAEIVVKAVETGYFLGQWPLETLKEVSELEGVAFIWAVDREGEIFLADDEKMWGRFIDEPDIKTREFLVKDSLDPKTGERIKLIIRPVYLDGPSAVLLGVSLKPVTAARNSAALFGLALFLIIVIFAVFLSFRFARGISRPIVGLTKGAEAIGKGNLDYRLDIKTGDEIERLADSFNEMTSKLKEQRERERILAKMKSEFISIAAHQLRTPLSAIKWTLRMFLDGDLGPLSFKQKEFMVKSFESNERMIRLINDLLDVTRIEEGRFGFNFVRQDFAEFLKKIVEQFAASAGEKRIDLKERIPPGPLEAVFDAEKLRMAVSNLLENALLYTLAGGRVEVSLEREKGFLKVSVRDSGIGIPAEQQARIFGKFFRGDNAVRLQTEGSGLGLYLAKNIARRHGGDIWFDSKEGKGSVFYLTVPVEEKFIPPQKSFEQFVAGL